MKKTTIATIILLGLAVIYGAWHYGRYYEKQQINVWVKGMFENTTDADFIIPDDLQYGGEIATGNCIYGKGGEYMTYLAKYAYNW